MEDSEKKKNPKEQNSKKDDVGWKDARTLAQTLWEMYYKGQARSDEFKAIVAYFGRERVKKILEVEARRRRGKTDDGNDV